jgi:hypothetical protein
MWRLGRCAALALCLAAPVAAAPGPGQGPAPETCLLRDGATLADLQAGLAAGCTEIRTAERAQVRLALAAGVAPAVLDLPARLLVQAGSLLDLGPGLTLRLQGGFQMPLERRRYVTGPGRLRTDLEALGRDTCRRLPSIAYPEWFGGQPDDDADDAQAIQQAADLGRDVQLAAGRYQLGTPVWLRGGQRISGAGKAATVLVQRADFELALLSDSLRYLRPALDIKYNNFAVGLDSDCAEITHLRIDGSAVSNAALAALTDTPAKRESRRHFHPTYVHAIRVATDFWMQETWAREKAAAAANPTIPLKLSLARPIQDVKIIDVDIVSPAISCINLQSSVGVRGLLIDHVDCDAREALNTTGFNAELVHADRRYANINEDVTIQDARFQGGRYAVLRSAGIRNLRILRSTFDAKPTTMFVASFYTSDAAGPLTAQVFNTSFRHLAPAAPGTGPVAQQQALGVVEITARGIHDRADLPFMVVPAGGTRLAFHDSSFIAARARTVPQTIPLVVNHIGTSLPTLFHRSAFIGGTHGILGDRGQTFILFNDQGINRFQPMTDAQRLQHQVNAVIDIDQCRFDGQSEAAIVTDATELHVTDSSFERIGQAPARPQPMVQFGQPKVDAQQTDSAFERNSFASDRATAWLAATGPSTGTRVRANRPSGGRVLPAVLPPPAPSHWELIDQP